ncbi:MAG: hypothetical protein K2Q10_03830, partial [Rhodospirillales bacterium]|nr:hypothetical protein [Rhodospirillales bacterium]
TTLATILEALKYRMVMLTPGGPAPLPPDVVAPLTAAWAMNPARPWMDVMLISEAGLRRLGLIPD